ncbi:MAG TPA: hypothetical protein VMQ45_11715 [Burkholderiaceae bacterium]|nr:hypothetical protein [Burkholderiaceae bacterium]
MPKLLVVVTGLAFFYLPKPLKITDASGRPTLGYARVAVYCFLAACLSVMNLFDSSMAGLDVLSGIYAAIAASFFVSGIILLRAKSVLTVDRLEHTWWPLPRRAYSIPQLEAMQWLDGRKGSLLLLFRGRRRFVVWFFASGRQHFLEQLKMVAPAGLWPTQ